jgi:lipopolysaccharide transport system ATP-binding protein
VSSGLSVEGLGKRYWIRRPNASEATLSRLDRVKDFFAIPLAKDLLQAQELWALKDLSFDVDAGSVLGIVGANGAGKTTLLKILARVISPTTGHVRGRGRVVSMLELGAGFDDEATGRENIYMNAALNGIPQDVVRRRFDAIIEFAELQAFVDTPVQFYSSGMYLRLAFSVAINMEPSILLADEILAVGDTMFQERCLQTVRQLSHQTGLTVLFVSHDMEAVTRICDRVIWIKGGQLHRDGDPNQIVTEYQTAAWEQLKTTATAPAPVSEHASRYGEVVDVKLLSADGREIGSPPRTEDTFIRIRFRTRNSRTRARCAFELSTKGVLVFRSTQPEFTLVPRGRLYEATARIPANLLAETSYTVSAGVTLIKGESEEHVLTWPKPLAFMVYGEHRAAGAGGSTLQRKGVIEPPLDWSAVQELDAVRA